MKVNISPDVEKRLAEIRADAAPRSPTVRVLAAYANHADCNLAALGFAARVDFDKLLEGTPYQVQFGQSPFAFSRGIAFERMVSARDYAETLNLLRTTMGFKIEDARTQDLRAKYQSQRLSMGLRANETREIIRQILLGRPTSYNLVGGAVLEANIGGISARFEADALAARFGGPIHAGEVKSFPVVDGRADPDKLSAALDQVSIYILLMRRLVDELGGDPDLVSRIALLITPTNVGLKPTMSQKDVGTRVARSERLLASVPDVTDIARSVPSSLTFNVVADQRADPGRRADELHKIADSIGTSYTPTCLSTCGNAFFCRERAFRSGSPCLTGPQSSRLLPGISSLNRAAALSGGAPPALNEAPVAPLLARAGRLYDAATKNSRFKSSSQKVAV